MTKKKTKSKSKKNRLKFTDEELSKILSHSGELMAGGQDRQGMNCDEIGCLIQCGRNLSTVKEVFDLLFDKNISSNIVFDWDQFHSLHIHKFGTVPEPDSLLRFLEQQGIG